MYIPRNDPEIDPEMIPTPKRSLRNLRMAIQDETLDCFFVLCSFLFLCILDHRAIFYIL